MTDKAQTQGGFKMRNESTYFHRQFPLESFKQFIGPDILDRFSKQLGRRRRKRLLGLEGFLWLGLFVSMHTLCPNLREIFSMAATLNSHELQLPLVSVSAFCQYRSFFPLKILFGLWQFLIQRIRQSLASDQRLWHGLQVIAVDATHLCLPEALWPSFGAHTGSRGQGPVQSHALVFYDVLARIPVKIRMGRAHDDERPMLLKLLRSVAKPNTILLIDSIFNTFQILAVILGLKGHWMVPLRASFKPKLLKRFSNHDGLYQIFNRRKLAGLPEAITLRIVTVQYPGFRPRRLVTSLLDPLEFTAEEIAHLYHERWRIETFFREFKYTLQVQHWHAQSLHAFYTEMLFFMLLTCLTRLAMAESGVPPALLSFQKSLVLMKRMLALAAFLPASQWDRLYIEALVQIRQYKIDSKKGRTFERDTQKRRKHSRMRKQQQLKEQLLHAT